MSESKAEQKAKEILEHPLVNREKLFKIGGISRSKYYNHKQKGVSCSDDYWFSVIRVYKQLTRKLGKL